MELTSEQNKEIIKLARAYHTPKEISEKMKLPVSVIYKPLRDAKLIKSQKDINEEAIEILRSDNMEVAYKIGLVTSKAIDKALELVYSSEDVESLQGIVKVTEMVAKVRGMIPKEAQTNIQVNNIIGFEFVAIDNANELVQTEIINIE